MPTTSPSDSHDLQARYESILDQQQIGWTSNRSFLRCLGRGGQGIVYLSMRQGADNFQLPVALKLFSPEQFHDDGGYEREMLRIAQVAGHVARIQHDNLVDVHNFITQDEIHVMEMEWIDGFDLRSLLQPSMLQQMREHVTDRRWKRINNVVVTKGQQHSRLKPGIAIAILRECLAGIAALHRNGIVHNDLKPSNIMLKRSGNVKVIDIGSAFEIEHAPKETACTPAYAAPEVLQGSAATPRSDLASLGYMLLALLSGSQCFAGMQYAELIDSKKSILEQLPTLLPAEEFAYSDLLIPLIRNLVDPDPSRRFQSAEDADLADCGAANFERELVKGDLASEYQNDIRQWVEEVEADMSTDDPDPDSGLASTRPVTRD